MQLEDDITGGGGAPLLSHEIPPLQNDIAWLHEWYSPAVLSLIFVDHMTEFDQ